MSNVKVVNKAYKIELGSDGVAFKNADRSSEKNFKHSIKISLAQCFSTHIQPCCSDLRRLVTPLLLYPIFGLQGSTMRFFVVLNEVFERGLLTFLIPSDVNHLKWTISYQPSHSTIVLWDGTMDHLRWTISYQPSHSRYYGPSQVVGVIGVDVKDDGSADLGPIAVCSQGKGVRSDLFVSYSTCENKKSKLCCI